MGKNVVIYILNQFATMGVLIERRHTSYFIDSYRYVPLCECYGEYGSPGKVSKGIVFLDNLSA